MWNLPPYPPKDYELKEVAMLQRDSPQFAPDDLPKITQKPLGIFCSPVEYPDGEVPKHIEIEGVSPYIMNKWTNELRAYWVDQPGKNDFFVNEVYRKYSMPPQSYDARFKHGEKVFNRSYLYELDCLEAKRLDKLRKKCQNDFQEFEDVFRKIEKEHEAKASALVELEPCQHLPPFWWENKHDADSNKCTLCCEDHKEAPIKSKIIKREEETSRSWAEKPNLTAVLIDDPCLRRKNMLIVGQPFKSEACNWYYDNYPQPLTKLR